MCRVVRLNRRRRQCWPLGWQFRLPLGLNLRLNLQPMKSNKSVSEGIGDESIQEKVAARILNLGLDLHYRQVTAGMQEDGGRIKPMGKMCYERFAHWVKKKLAEG
jgi:hypothetical protein